MDIQPNVRRDGREVVFASNRGGTSAFGGQDIWVATRKDVNGPTADIWDSTREKIGDEPRPSTGLRPRASPCGVAGR